MLKNITHKEKFTLLKNWMPSIIDTIKKDLKNEHLKKDWAFVKQYFPGKNPNKLTTDEMAQAYLHVVENSENGEELAEFISNRWLIKHTDLYYFFEKELSKIRADFNELEELDHKQSQEIIESSINQFGVVNTYLFAVLNSVVFPKEIYGTLSNRATANVEQAQIEAQNHAEMKSLQDMQRAHEEQIARLTDKYEKKLIGLQKKYHIDIEALKKQISTLQRKISK